MYRKFTATLVAAAIAITSMGTAPAYADRDRDDLARALAIVLGAAVVGKVIHDSTKKKKKSKNVTHHKAPVYAQPRTRQSQHIQPRRERQINRRTHIQPRIQPRPLPRAVNRGLLPQRCFVNVQRRGDDLQFFPQRCLQNNYAQAHRLPQRCFDVYRTPNGKRRGYEARCLYQEGYRLSRR